MSATLTVSGLGLKPQALMSILSSLSPRWHGLAGSVTGRFFITGTENGFSDLLKGELVAIAQMTKLSTA
jgi:hypothetical protein